MDWGRSIHVPAQSFQKWEEAQPKNLHVVHLTCQFFCTVVAIWNYFRPICMVLLHQNLPQSKDVESLLHTEVHAGSTIFPVSF